MSQHMTQNPNGGFGADNGMILGAVGAVAGLTAGAALDALATYHRLPPLRVFLPFALHHLSGLPEVIGAAAGGVGGFCLGFNGSNNVGRDRIVRGSDLKTARALAKSTRLNDGLHIHPALRLGMHDERAHLLLLGGSGSGKTTILWPFILEARARGDRQLIFSYKGDFQQRWPGGFTLLAPCDARSSIWEMGADIRTHLDAEALAATLIQSPKGGSADPMWADGARALLAAIIFALQDQVPGRWTAGMLAELLQQALADFAMLAQIVAGFNPTASAYIAGGESSKTTASFLAQLATAAKHIRYLAAAEQTAKPDAERWSARRWVRNSKNDPPLHRTVILGFLPSATLFSQAFAASVIETVVLRVLDLPDASPGKRRMWLIADEVPQAGRVPALTTALEAARSKGLRVVLGLQGTQQLSREYDSETRAIWVGQTATKIVAHLEETDDQKWASALAGEVEIDRMHTSVASNYGRPSGQSRTTNYARVKEPVMAQSRFKDELFVQPPDPDRPRQPAFVRAVVLSPYGKAMLDWTFDTPPARRPAFVKAPWLGGKPAHKAKSSGATTAKPDRNRVQRRPETGGDEGAEIQPQAAGEGIKTAGRGRVVTAERRSQTNKALVLAAEAGDGEPAQEGENVLEDQISEHVETQVIDAVLPGAGHVLEMFSAMSEVAGTAAKGATPAVHVQQQVQQEQEVELDEEYEHEHD